MFHDSRGDINKLAKVLKECINEINNQEEEIKKIKEELKELKKTTNTMIIEDYEEE